jgi:hypothetical protein
MKFKVALIFLIITIKVSAQNNPALNMAEILAYGARFTPYDKGQTEILRDLDTRFLITHLKTDNEKNSFWVNIYNSYMLTFLRDTLFEGVYTNFYKKKNVIIAGKAFSLFDIEHEFIRLGKKSKVLGFKKSKINKDTTWKKLRPSKFDERTVFLMYRGLYGYPPFQIIESGNIETSYFFVAPRTNQMMDWLKPYMLGTLDAEATKFIKTPFAVQINNFYPKYEGVKFKEEEKNPWLK